MQKILKKFSNVYAMGTIDVNSILTGAKVKNINNDIPRAAILFYRVKQKVLGINSPAIILGGFI